MSEYNEDAYRDARKSMNPTPCAFEKGVLARCISCSKAEKHLLAERETVNCAESAAQAWERSVLEKLALSAIEEKRRARRWGIFFKLLLVAYVTVALVFSSDYWHEMGSTTCWARSIHP